MIGQIARSNFPSRQDTCISQRTISAKRTSRHRQTETYDVSEKNVVPDQKSLPGPMPGSIQVCDRARSFRKPPEQNFSKKNPLPTWGSTRILINLTTITTPVRRPPTPQSQDDQPNPVTSRTEGQLFRIVLIQLPRFVEAGKKNEIMICFFSFYKGSLLGGIRTQSRDIALG